MPLLGSHLSIAGGYYRAVEKAAELGMDTVQIFTKNNNQWRAKPLTDEDVSLFQQALKTSGIVSPCAHDSYLINLASPDPELRNKSLEAYVVELERAEALGLKGVVMHPGSHVTSTEDEGLTHVVAGLNEAHRRTRGCTIQTWVEATAGQGTNLGHRFEHLARILQGGESPERFGICLDTCHIFAAGYALQTPEEYQSTMDELDAVVGLHWVRAFHLNDSKKPRGSRVDRHEHIGEGEMGPEPFRFVMNDPRFADLPMYLETKKEQRDGEEMDAVNLRVLKGLMANGQAAGSRNPGPTKSATRSKKSSAKDVGEAARSQAATRSTAKKSAAKKSNGKGTTSSAARKSPPKKS